MKGRRGLGWETWASELHSEWVADTAYVAANMAAWAAAGPAPTTQSIHSQPLFWGSMIFFYLIKKNIYFFLKTSLILHTHLICRTEN